jgi:exodeoxyribonuclease VII large subunit
MFGFVGGGLQSGSDFGNDAVADAQIDRLGAVLGAAHRTYVAQEQVGRLTHEEDFETGFWGFLITFEDMRNRSDIPSVSELTWHIKELLEGNFTGIRVGGEVSQPTRSANGHVYFTLKDDQAQIACVIWRSSAQRMPVELAHGQQVVVLGDVQVYAPSGRYQIIVKSVQQAGEGALQQAFERLKARLEAEGLFAAERKKPLPAFPRVIGVVTSESGAAFQDIRSTLERRYPLARVLLYHAAVQGVGAAAEIARGIGYFATSGQADVLIVGRGGGSLEDLWPFNEEIVARAIAACEIPVVSAVGHETDFSISDFVADVRAATPTQAAVLVAPDVTDLQLLLDTYEKRCERQVRALIGGGRDTIRQMLKTHALMAIRDRMRFSRERVGTLQQRMQAVLAGRTGRARDVVQLAGRTMLPSVRMLLMRRRDTVSGLERSLLPAVRMERQRKREAWQTLNFRLQQVNPTEPLERGFTRILQDGVWVRRREALRSEAPVTVQWRDGEAVVRAEE